MIKLLSQCENVGYESSLWPLFLSFDNFFCLFERQLAHWCSKNPVHVWDKCYGASSESSRVKTQQLNGCSVNGEFIVAQSFPFLHGHICQNSTGQYPPTCFSSLSISAFRTYEDKLLIMKHIRDICWTFRSHKIAKANAACLGPPMF